MVARTRNTPRPRCTRSTCSSPPWAHINTLFLQQVLAEPAWVKKLSDEDRRGLTALFWSNINPYGTFRLEMDKRLRPGAPGRSSPSADRGGRGTSGAINPMKVRVMHY